MKTYVFMVHFRKAGIKTGEPWTIHYRGQCIPARGVEIYSACRTVFRPDKKTNPRAWIRGAGVVSYAGKGVYIIEAK